MKVLGILLLSTVLLAACSVPPEQLAAAQPAAEPTGEPAQAVELAELSAGGYETSGEMVNYYTDVSGYYAHPTAEGSYPGVVLIHEWWGLNDNIKATADALASNGYAVLAVDLYHGQVATDADGARALVGAVSNGEATANLGAAQTYLRNHGSTKVASWGYCFGGGQSMNFALASSAPDATVVYYGDVRAALTNPTAVKHPVLLIYGDQDTSTPASAAQDLQVKLDARGIKTELYIYPGVGHAFANPSNAGHNVAHTKDAWDKTLAFLADTLR